MKNNETIKNNLTVSQVLTHLPAGHRRSSQPPPSPPQHETLSMTHQNRLSPLKHDWGNKRRRTGYAEYAGRINNADNQIRRSVRIRNRLSSSKAKALWSSKSSQKTPSSSKYGKAKGSSAPRKKHAPKTQDTKDNQEVDDESITIKELVSQQRSYKLKKKHESQGETSRKKFKSRSVSEIEQAEFIASREIQVPDHVHEAADEHEVLETTMTNIEDDHSLQNEPDLNSKMTEVRLEEGCTSMTTTEMHMVLNESPNLERGETELAEFSASKEIEVPDVEKKAETTIEHHLVQNESLNPEMMDSLGETERAEFSASRKIRVPNHVHEVAYEHEVLETPMTNIEDHILLNGPLNSEMTEVQLKEGCTSIATIEEHTVENESLNLEKGETEQAEFSAFKEIEAPIVQKKTETTIEDHLVQNESLNSEMMDSHMEIKEENASCEEIHKTELPSCEVTMTNIEDIVDDHILKNEHLNSEMTEVQLEEGCTTATTEEHMVQNESLNLKRGETERAELNASKEIEVPNLQKKVETTMAIIEEHLAQNETLNSEMMDSHMEIKEEKVTYEETHKMELSSCEVTMTITEDIEDDHILKNEHVNSQMTDVHRAEGCTSVVTTEEHIVQNESLNLEKGEADRAEFNASKEIELQDAPKLTETTMTTFDEHMVQIESLNFKMIDSQMNKKEMMISGETHKRELSSGECHELSYGGDIEEIVDTIEVTIEVDQPQPEKINQMEEEDKFLIPDLNLPCDAESP